MKFLHLGDLHLGRVVNGFPMLDDQRLTLEALLDDAEEREVDAIVLAGDLYDSAQATAPAVRTLSDFLVEAVGRGFEVLAIPGNHDSADRVGFASELLAGEGVHIAPPFDGDISPVGFEDEHGSVWFWLLPFLRPADVRSVYSEDESIGTDFTSALRAVIDRLPLDPSERNVLVAHQFVTVGGDGPELSDSETVWVGTAGNVEASVFEPFDYVALGHLHCPQAVGVETVRYGGSLLKYSYSEIDHRKSAALVELGAKGDVSIELLPLRPPRDLREITGTLDELVKRGERGEEETDDYIHAILTDEELPLHALHKLREVYPRVMGLDLENTRTHAKPDLAKLTVELSDLNPLELFGQFFREQNGRGLTDEERAAVESAFTTVLDEREEA